MEKFWTSDELMALMTQSSDLEFPFRGYCCPIVKNLNPTEYHQWCIEMMADCKDDLAAGVTEKCTVEFVL